MPQSPPAREMAKRIQHLAMIGTKLAVALGHLRQARLDERPFLICQISGIALGLACDLCHPATTLVGPHPELERIMNQGSSHFQTVSKHATDDCWL